MFDWLLSKLRKKQSPSTTPNNTSESEKPIKADSKPAAEKVSTPEPVQPVSQTVEPPVVQATSTVAIATENSNVPQDSMLRRHYLTHLRAISDAETVSEEPQTTAVKEEAQIAIEPAIEEKTATDSVAVAAPHNASKIPEDSALRRHYLTQLYAQVQANLPPRPTDATLRRHYDAMVKSEVEKQLAN